MLTTITKFRILPLFIVAISACAIFSGCSEQKTDARRTAVAGGILTGGRFRINMIRGNPNGVDPAIINSKLSDDIALQIYDRLITFDSMLNVVPELATSWEISPDGKRYTFHIRTDVFFHDNPCFPNGKGRRMTAADAAYSLARCADPTAKTVHFWAFKDKVSGANEFHAARLRGDTATKLHGITAPDDSTLIIKLERPYAPFLLMLANSFSCVVPHEATRFYGKDFFQHPVGTGPFVFVEWQHDRQMLLQRNPHYWQRDGHGNQLPYLDGVTVSFIKDDKLQFNEFESGNLEECFTLPTEYADNIFVPNSRNLSPRFSHFILQAKPAMLTWFCDFLCTKAPFDKPDVRRAFSYSIDREKITRYVLRGMPFAPALHGITPPVMPGYDISSITGYDFNPAKARELLSHAGYPNGKNFPEITLYIYQEPRLTQVAEAVQQMLNENLNIHISIKIVQFAELLDLAEQGKISFWGTRWYGDYPDPENYLNLFDGSLVPVQPGLPSYPNSTRYRNAESSAALAEATQTLDANRRAELYRRAESLAMADAPAIMLFYEMHYRLLQPYTRNYPLDPMARVVLKRAWLAEK
ncbi:ABC transporter substrate-binding protein [Ignavibacteria bacterium]|nr:ABC transporter substrate-binding protein [Bacteroidota bacterium]MCZ2133625.1 ABC transporter substrate-binding protein [Bacteroidota bacterium]